ncbi:MAG: ArsR family transcriptional regulator [Candidatus Lokiarchaeota archaeon]|nr:ArsR family transcriptional regulator [Candidatus Lokiarchaeota archaeon]
MRCKFFKFDIYIYYMDLISTFSNFIRIKILLLLNEKKLSMTKISELINTISKSEISRHLTKLAEVALIQKDITSGREYEISSFGKLVITVFEPILFIFKNKNYFQNHSLDYIPPILMKSINALEKAECILGIGKVMYKAKEIFNIPLEEIWMMIDNPYPIDMNVKKINFIVPPHMLELKGEIDTENIQYRVRVLSNIPILILITNLGNGALAFSKVGEKSPDYNEAFYIFDKKGINFLKSLWDYFWNKGKIFM